MLTSCVSIVCYTNRSYSSINPYQDGAVYYLLKEASNPNILASLDLDSAIVGQAGILKVFSDKCVGSDKVSFLKNKATSISVLSGASAQRCLDPQRQQGDYEDGINRVGTPEVTSGSGSDDLFLSPNYHVGLKGYDQLSFDSDTSSVCVTVPSPNDISKDVGMEVSSDEVGRSGLNNASVSLGLDESVKVQLHNPSLPWYLVLTMMTAFILGTFFKLNEMPKSMFALQGVRDKIVSRQYSRYFLRKHKKAKQMSFTRFVQLVMLSITLLNVLTLGTSSSVYAHEIGENAKENNLIGESGEHDPDDDLKDRFVMNSEGQNLINVVSG